ncbi:hypothetical protein D3C80_2011660 [compost metagenome]
MALFLRNTTNEEDLLILNALQYLLSFFVLSHNLFSFLNELLKDNRGVFLGIVLRVSGLLLLRRAAGLIQPGAQNIIGTWFR